LSGGANGDRWKPERFIGRAWKIAAVELPLIAARQRGAALTVKRAASPAKTVADSG